MMDETLPEEIEDAFKLVPEHPPKREDGNYIGIEMGLYREACQIWWEKNGEGLKNTITDLQRQLREAKERGELARADAGHFEELSDRFHSEKKEAERRAEAAEEKIEGALAQLKNGCPMTGGNILRGYKLPDEEEAVVRAMIAKIYAPMAADVASQK